MSRARETLTYWWVTACENRERQVMHQRLDPVISSAFLPPLAVQPLSLATSGKLRLPAVRM